MSAAARISRPINSNLFLSANTYDKAIQKIKIILKSESHLREAGLKDRENLKKCIYTVQQSIGSCLDAVPSGESNKARKLTGDYFELFIRLLINYAGFKCFSGLAEIPITEKGETLFKMKYQVLTK